MISNNPQASVIVADTNKSFSRAAARELEKWSKQHGSTQLDTDAFQAAKLPHWFSGKELWPSASPARLAMLEDLSDRFPVLEDRQAGTRVGIGVATGADKVFITEDPDLMESDRLLPLSMVQDTKSGKLHWQGRYLVNPWDRSGNLVDLESFPRLRSYLLKNSQVLRARHVAAKQPERWYRTIDKVDNSLIGRKKLLLPDMNTTIHPVLDDGGLYPHHNLYCIVSDTWDMDVLGGLLMSRVAQAFVQAYAVKMRGWTLRCQAQYLRKFRVPEPSGVSDKVKDKLAQAFHDRDVEAATDAALKAYGLEHLPA